MNERLVLGVTGSIAAYKAVYLLRVLRECGFRVPVVLTDAAQRFVGRVTFEALTSEGVYDDLWARREALTHISLLDGTNLILVAPATADIIAKAAHGLADDLLSALLLAASPSQVLFAPAMNQGMWLNPATQENVRILKSRGVRFVEPGEGELACGVLGAGRLADVDEIVLAVESIVRSNPVLAGKKVVVTCGRTEEEIDPVRVLTNRSSGLMGAELARAFLVAGAEVTLVAGEMSVPLPSGCNLLWARSAAEMLSTLRALMPDTDALLMAAAVGDYTPLEVSEDKLKNQELTLRLEKTPDILAALKGERAVRIGFSVETSSSWLENARTKLESKGLDAIFANPCEVIGKSETKGTIIYATGETMEVPHTSKRELAERLVGLTAELLEKRDTNA